jgi:aminoglycoside/choline kinase family phosphotransferase
MDDLGDELLQSRILGRPEGKLGWLRRATELLAKLHGETYPVPPDLPVASRRFDRQKYLDELLFTSEHLREKYLGLPPYGPREKAALGDFCESLGRVGFDVFCHRDYHTRNLLVKDDGLWVIDFQDARMGPIHYDLASLLYDAYVPTTAAERDELLALYRSRIAGYPLSRRLEWDDFDQEFSAVAFQRVVKAAGSFASFFTRYGKKTHLPYLLPALRSARELQRHSGRLRDQLVEVFPLDTWIELASKKN